LRHSNENSLFLARKLSKLCVLRLRLFVDRDVGIGVLPESEEFLIRLARGGLVAHHHLRAAELQKCKRAINGIHNNAGVIEHFAKLRLGLLCPSCLQIGLAPDIRQRRPAFIRKPPVDRSASPDRRFRAPGILVLTVVRMAIVGEAIRCRVASVLDTELFRYDRGGPKKPSVVIATWAGYKKAGPLLISTEHRGTADGGPFHLWFTNVAVKLAGSDKWMEAR
jgi:hypothetical protein